MIYDLMPRLISHQESQKAYYERQLEAANRELGRLMLLSSGQLQLWELPLYPEGSNEAYQLKAVTMGGDESQDRPGGQVIQSLGEKS